MKLYGNITLDVAGEEILERPGPRARARKALGGDPDLRSGRMRAALEATAVVDSIRDALTELGATNAVTLVIDDVVVFPDRERRADDLGDLFLAFHNYSSVIGGGFGLLRLAVEHVLFEAGLHIVLEVQARTEHSKHEPAVRVIVSGRIQAFEPQPGEDAASYRTRVEPLARDRSILELAQLSFHSFVVRARDAIARAMPEGRANVVASEVRVVMPDKPGAPWRAEPRPTDPNYDPHDALCPSPMVGIMNMVMLGSSLMMAPGINVVDASNTPVDNVDAAADDGSATSDEDVGTFDTEW